jgi:hypothetical protein
MRLFFLLLLLPFTASAQNSCRAEDHYSKWISFEKKYYKGGSYTSRNINDSTGEFCYAALVQGRAIFFDYLLINATAATFFTRIEAIKDTTRLRTAAIPLLQKDTLFNRTMNNLVARTFTATQPKDTLDFEEVLDVAVKFFIVDGITKDGDYKSHVCVGINGIKETMKKRNLLLEAFCVDAIFARINSEDTGELYDEFIANMEEMAQVSFGKNHTAQLHRAQGAVYLLMWRSELLRRTLREAYEAQKERLPFVIRTEDHISQ